MSVLAFLTTVVNLLGLAVTLCLGFYIVTRHTRSGRSWLAALLLWSMSGFYLHNTMAVNVPGSGILPWLRPAIMLTVPLGFHLLLLLPPTRDLPPLDFYLPRLRLPGALPQTLGDASRAAAPLAYLLAVGLTLGGIFPFPTPPASTAGPIVLLSQQSAGPILWTSLAYLGLFGLLGGLHVWQGYRAAAGARQRRAYHRLIGAVLLACLGGAYLAAGIWLHLPVPSLPGDLAVGTVGLMLTSMIAEHNARRDGIDLKRDLAYVGLIVGSITTLYVVLAEILYAGGHIFSPLTLILIIIVAISSLMLYDGLRTTADRLFYRDQFRQLRSNLRALARETGIGQPLPDRLQAILSALGGTLQVRTGFIALRSGDGFICEATLNSVPTGQAFALAALAAAEIADLPRPGEGRPESMALLVPIHQGEDQCGAVVLGPREAGQGYGDAERMLLDDLAEQLAAVIQATRLQEENARVISDLVADFRQREHDLQRQVQHMVVRREDALSPVLPGVDEAAFVSLVEDALRHLHDYPYLGGHALARLRVVDGCLAGQRQGVVTHLERGKALGELLGQAIAKLRPAGAEPASHAVPPREWQQFIVLHAAYVQGEPNRDIMGRLFVGEGTFNRTRRRALHGVARALQEMEREGAGRVLH